jgi:hypothetical protein
MPEFCDDESWALRGVKFQETRKMLRMAQHFRINRPEPPGEACRGGSYAFENQAETAKSIPSPESADVYLSALRTERSVGAIAPRR